MVGGDGIHHFGAIQFEGGTHSFVTFATLQVGEELSGHLVVRVLGLWVEVLQAGGAPAQRHGFGGDGVVGAGAGSKPEGHCSGDQQGDETSSHP